MHRLQGGTEVEIAFKKPLDGGEVRNAVEGLGFKAPDVVRVQDEKNPSRFLIRVQEVTALDEHQRAALMDALCYAAVGGGDPPADRCPAGSRPTEMKFSPGGDKITRATIPSRPWKRSVLKPHRSRVWSCVTWLRTPDCFGPGSQGRGHAQVQGDQLMDGLRSSLGEKWSPDSSLRSEWVGPKAGKQLRDAAFKSVGIAMIFIMAYLAFRFDMRFAPGRHCPASRRLCRASDLHVGRQGVLAFRSRSAFDRRGLLASTTP